MLEAFVPCLLVEQAKDTSESVEASATPCWQNQQVGADDGEDKSTGGLAPPVSRCPRGLG
jgi:hypothetical protein